MNKSEGRLLTDEVDTILDYFNQTINKAMAEGTDRPEIEDLLKHICKAQDVKTASIKEAECQERVERIFREIGSKSITRHYGTGESVEYTCIPTDVLQALEEEGEK